MKNQIYIILFLSFVISSCTTFEPKPFGDEMEISMKDNKEDDIEGTLLFITDSSFFVLTDTSIIEAGFKKSNDVKINGYSDRTWLIPVLIGEAIPGIVIGFTVSAWYLMLIPVINYFLYELGTPKAPGIDSGSINKYTAKKLIKYARFPMGLTSEQFIEFTKNKKVLHIF